MLARATRSSMGTCRRSLGPCRFISVAHVAHYVQQEVVIAGALHVSAAQAGSCMQRFGDIDAARAPALPPLEDVLADAAEPQHSSSSSSSSSRRRVVDSSEGAERVMNEAFCLAQPPEDPTENNSPLRGQPQPSSSALPERLQLSPGRAQLRVSGLNPSASSLCAREAGKPLECGASSCQYAYARAALSAQALYANEALQASAAVRRRRRRVLVRLLRQGRERTAAGLSVLQDSPPGQLLASISASISSLSSWDDDGGAVGGPTAPGIGSSPLAAAALARVSRPAAVAVAVLARLP